MTVLGLGLAALGRPAYINLGHSDDYPEGRDVDRMRERTHQLLDAAWSAGLRHVDAARSYGLAEQFLGDWLRSHPGRRESLTIGSKWGYTYVGDWRVDADQHEVKDHSLATFERQWPETLAALGTTPDTYLIHSVTPDSPALDDDKLITALEAIADADVLVGISTSGPRQADVIDRALSIGAPFRAVQSTWNLLDPTAGPALRRAYDAGWHVALKETVANGQLTDRASVPEPLRQVAGRLGTTPDAVALTAALDQPASVVLLGVTTIEQLASNLASTRIRLSPDDTSTLVAAAEDPGTYWDRRSALPWN